jgi:hypothetical protein
MQCASCVIPFPVIFDAAKYVRRDCDALPAGCPAHQPAKTRFYNNLKSFIQKQSRFATDVPDF